MRAPALSPIDCWKVEQRDGRIFVKEKREQAKAAGQADRQSRPAKIVIVGGGAAGFAAAEMLRRRGFGGSIVMLSQDAAAPVDRPNLSKDYLAGSAPEDWLPLRPNEFYAENGIELRLNAEVVGIDVKTREVMIAGGNNLVYDRLLLATGAEPVRLPIPGADQPHVHMLRSLADCRAIIDGRQGRTPRARHRRKLHRTGGRCRAARARHRGPCGGAGTAADGAGARAADGRFRARAARRTWRRLSSSGHRDCD